MARTNKNIDYKLHHKKDRFGSGPGGMNCICCFPAPGSNERRKLIKAWRRKQSYEAFRCEEME